jgi:hypothetical protein
MVDGCPKCGGQDWKSAKLVVLEGTTKTEGALDGELVEKGAFHGGGVRDFLLSDRWFSYESPLSAQFSSTTVSVLVDEIKALMVKAGAQRPMPPAPSEPSHLIKPQEPTKLARDKGNFFASNPENVKQPVAPTPPENPADAIEAFENRTWWKNLENWAFSRWFLNITIFGLAIYFFPDTFSPIIKYVALFFGLVSQNHSFSEGISLPVYLHIPIFSDFIQQLELNNKFIFGISFILFSILVSFLQVIFKLPFIGRIENRRREKYDEKLKSIKEDHAKNLNQHEVKLKNHKDKLAEWNSDIAEFKAEKSAYNQQLAAYENEMKLANADFQRRIEDYEAQVAEVRSFRSELWNRARMCTRCGAVYLGVRPNN